MATHIDHPSAVSSEPKSKPRESVVRVQSIPSQPQPIVWPRREYKPLVLRTPFLLLLLCSLLALLGLIEYACRTLPTEPWRKPITTNDKRSVTVVVRQVVEVGGVTTTPGGTSVTNPGGFLDPGVKTTTPNEGGGGRIYALPSSSYLDAEVKSKPAGAANPNAVINPATQPTAAAAPKGSLPQPASPNPGVDPVVNPAGAAPNNPATNPAANPKSNPSNPDEVLGGGSSGGSSGGASEGSSEGPLGDSTSNGDESGVLAGDEAPHPDNDDLVSVLSGDSAGESGPGSDGTSTISGEFSGVDQQASQSTGPNRLDRPVYALTRGKYFVGTYLPTLMAIALRIVIGFVYATTKMLEPFYSLTSSAGAEPKDFFNINFLSTNDSLDPLLAMFSGHWLMLLTSLLYVGAGLITPFASEFMRITRFCNSDNLCAPELRVSPTIGRVIQALLAITSLMLLAFWWLERRHRSGLYSDPSSIASMASLLHHPEVLDDLRRIPPWASKKDMEGVLAGKRYHLRSYFHPNGKERYGLVPSHTYDIHGELAARHSVFEPNVDRSVRQQRYRKVSRGARDIIFALVTVGIIVVISYYYKVGDDSGFEQFWNSQTFGPRFIMTIVGIIIHSEWKRVEREICILEPFRTLSKGQAWAHSTILVQRTLNPITTAVTGIYRRHFFVAVVALMAVFAEALIVTLGGIPFNAGQLYRPWTYTLYLTLAILATMLLVLVAVYVRPRGPDLPRHPSTVASVMSYLCASWMLEDFAETVTLDSKTRDQNVRDMARQYTLKESIGVDGVMRWCVDYDYNDTHV
ncbi:MAG: hypothetical protein M1833_001833 [Piccolia ochrophora]|nr:MAG: hypothetical protein M1833_001833 [Piccolia ochrophora]